MFCCYKVSATSLWVFNPTTTYVVQFLGPAVFHFSLLSLIAIAASLVVCDAYSESTAKASHTLAHSSRSCAATRAAKRSSALGCVIWHDGKFAFHAMRIISSRVMAFPFGNCVSPLVGFLADFSRSGLQVSNLSIIFVSCWTVSALIAIPVAGRTPFHSCSSFV